MKLLLIEDDVEIRDVLVDLLTSHHWVVEQANDGETGLELAKTQSYDLILLDIGLPRLDGITVCKRLRTGGYENPILLLTGQDSTEAQIAGLDAGADDYVTKPFNLDILLARVRAVSRKGKASTGAVVWDAIQMDPTSGEVTCHGQPLHLTAKEYCLLELFLLNPKRIYSRRAILDRLWDHADSPGEETVSTHVKCIRQKIKALGGTDPIETVHGLGYRLRSLASSIPSSIPTSRNPSGFITFPSAPSATPAPAASNPITQAKAQAITTRVWEQFKTQYLDQINTLSTLVNQLQPDINPPEQLEIRQEIRQRAHKMVGSLGMFGLLEASQQARQLEQLMQQPQLNPAQISNAVQWVTALKAEIEQAQAVLPSGSTVAHPAPPHSQSQAFSTPSVPMSMERLPTRILIVDDDLLLADRLRVEAIAWNFQVEIATDLNIARQIIARTPPNVILLDLNFPGTEDGLTLMRELDQQLPKIPVVMLTAREDLRDRVAAAQLGVSAFLHKPLPAYEILKTVTDVLNRNIAEQRGDRVLIVDDDPQTLQLLSTLLVTEEVQVFTCPHPQEFWTILANCHPDLLILDWQMPEFNGVELCRVVRTAPQWQHLKVIFLSAHTDPQIIAAAYAAGADDYVSKSLSSTELVTRILYRLKSGLRTQ